MSRRRARHREALLIDTNLLLLLLIGAMDPAHVERFRRTKKYTREDYALLAAFVSRYERLVTTPNVLTEVSNLAGQLSEPLRERAFLSLGVLISQYDERFHPSRELVLEEIFPKLGLADTSVQAAVDNSVTVLTDDLPLYLRLSAAGIEAINFNHLRSGSWQ